MATVLLIIHIMLALALIGVVLLQRSEGGALGIGGGGGGGGFMTGRGAANFLTRVTAGLAAAFFATSLLLSLIAQPVQRSILDVRRRPPGTTQPAKAPRAPTAPPSPLPTIDLNKTNQGTQVPDAPAPNPRACRSRSSGTGAGKARTRHRGRAVALEARRRRAGICGEGLAGGWSRIASPWLCEPKLGFRMTGGQVRTLAMPGAPVQLAAPGQIFASRELLG